MVTGAGETVDSKVDAKSAKLRVEQEENLY